MQYGVSGNSLDSCSKNIGSSPVIANMHNNISEKAYSLRVKHTTHNGFIIGSNPIKPNVGDIA